MKKKLTSVDIRKLKGKRKITSLTAYDFFTASTVEDAGIDFVLVGDSLGMVVQGHDDTLKVELEHMIYHTQCVRRGCPNTFLVTDMPWMSYHVSTEQTVINASRLIREGAEAVKIEGGVKRQEMIRACANAEIVVMGHVGLTPQSVNTLGGFKIQKEKNRILEDALAVQEAGAFSVVLESMPLEIANEITAALDIPTIGIGAGNGCDGQILVWHDVLGLNSGHTPFFVKKYAHLHEEAVNALKEYTDDVIQGRFPDEGSSFSNLKEKKCK